MSRYVREKTKAKRWDVPRKVGQEYALPDYCLYCGAPSECVKVVALVEDIDTNFPFPMCWPCSDRLDRADSLGQLDMVKAMLDQAGRHMEGGDRGPWKEGKGGDSPTG